MTGEARRCVTCGDLAVPMRVASLEEPDSGLAICVSDEGDRRTVDVGLVPDLVPGESILVHAGAALARLPAGSSERG